MNTDHRYTEDTDSSNMANVGEVESEGTLVAEAKSLKTRVKHLSSVFDYLHDLGCDEEHKRVEAGVNLLRHLLRKQNESEGASVCSELQYALKRMVCGVCSVHVHKRAGFFSVLVETLKLFDEISAQDVWEIISTVYEGEVSKKEKMSTECYTGCLFAIGALIHANTFLTAPSRTQTLIIEKLIGIGKRKAVFLPCVYSFIVDLMQKIDDSKFEEVVWLHLKSLLSKKLEEHTADSLRTLLEARDRFPSVVKKKFLLRNLGHKYILSEESISHLCKLLMDAPGTILNNHPFYEILIPKVASSHLLIPFWEYLVKKVEKISKPQSEKALINFIVKLVPLIDKNQIPELLCDGFMGLIVKIYQNRKNNAELIVDISGLLMNMTSILKSDEVDEEIKLSFIRRLMLFPGPFVFDAFDGLKITVQLWPFMSVIGMEQIGSILKNIILANEPKVKNLEGKTCPWNKRERSYAIKIFSKLLSITVQEDKLNWKINQLEFLVSQGFISNSKSDDVVNLGIASEVRNNFFKVLDPALSSENHSIKVLSSLVHHINSLISSKRCSSKWYQHLPESLLAAWKKMFELITNLHSIETNGTDSKESGNKLFLILFLHMGMQLLRDATLAEEALQELHSCYERTQNNTENSRKKRRSIKNEDDEPQWVEVMMDLFLSLLSHHSTLHRNIVRSVFPHLCPYLTPTSVHQLLEVLDPNAEKMLRDDSEGESSEESDDEDANENPSKQIPSQDEKEEDDDDDDDEDEDEDEDLEDDDEPVNDQLKIAVQNALKKAMNNGRDSDEESIDMDQMTEEERNRLDAALSEAFKLVKYTQSNKKSRKQSKDDETLMHFRIRVLDLIVLYLSKKPDLGLVLDIILPLFDLLEFCIKDNHQLSLEKKVRSCLMKLCHVKQFSNISGVNEQIISEVLAKLLQKGQRVAAVYLIMKTPLCKCSSFLARTSLHINRESHQDISKSPILDVYKEALISFFTNRDSLLPVEVFGNVLMISWNGAWTLAEIILRHAFSSECRPFRRSQALQLLNKFFCNRRLVIDSPEDNTKALYKMEKTILKKAVEILLNVMNGKQKEYFVVKERNIEELLGLIFAILKIHRQKEEKEANAACWKDVKNVILQYWQYQNFGSGIRSNLRKLASALNLELVAIKNSTNKGQNKQNSVVENMELENINQRVADNNVESLDSSEDNGDKGYESGNGINDEKDIEEPPPVNARKRKKSDDKKGRTILKKQAKYARLAAMSDGLEGNYKFTQLQLEDETRDAGNKFTNRRKRKKSCKKTKKPEQHEKIQKLDDHGSNCEKLEESGGEIREVNVNGADSNKSDGGGKKRHKKQKTVEEVNESNISESKTIKKFQHKMKRGEDKKKRRTNAEHEQQILCV